MIDAFEKEIEERGGSFGNDVIDIQSPRYIKEEQELFVSRMVNTVGFFQSFNPI